MLVGSIISATLHRIYSGTLIIVIAFVPQLGRRLTNYHKNSSKVYNIGSSSREQKYDI